MKQLFLVLLTALACVWGGASAQAQTRTIHGTILDAANNEPLIGATIAPIGGGQGAAADIDGKFVLHVPQNVTKARVSYIGYQSKTVELKDGMTIHLETSATNLDEAVVIAYGTASKESLTGSVAVIGNKEIEKRPVTSVTSALEGAAPGVQVNGSFGIPGNSPSIIIRGINTVNGTTAPLYVLDGMIFNGGINDINPNDVESISVLKDAASCALYGSKGANGVILITTKRAKKAGRVEVTLQVRQGMYMRGLPQYDRLDYNEWNEVFLKASTNGLMTSNPKYTFEQARQQALEGFFRDAGVVNLYGTNDLNDSDATEYFDANGKILPGLQPLDGYNDLDWWKAISRTGHRQEYNVNATGGSEKFNIFASAGYTKEKGYLLKTDFERFNGRINANFNPVSWLRFGVNLAGVSQFSNQPQFSSDNLSSTSNPFHYQTTAPGLPYYLHDWATGEIMIDANGNPIWNTTTGYPTFISNRGYILRANDQNYDYMSVDANVYGTVILPYGFEAEVRGSLLRYRQTSTEYGSPIIGSAEGFGRLKKTFYRNSTYTFQQSLRWSHQYGDHHVEALLSHDNYARDYGYTGVSNKDEIFPGVMEISNFATNENTTAYAYQYRTENYMARGKYNYDQKYYAEASLSRNGSSRFAKNSRWGTFWSVGAGWVITKEKFMEDLTWLDYLKLRLAYGSVGTDAAAGVYATWDTYSLASTTAAGFSTMFPSQIANPNLKWEATKMLDIALEGTLFNGRLNFSVGFFRKTASDLLYDVAIPGSTGTTSTGGLLRITRNIGSMHNDGWELSFSGDIIRNNNITWSASFDATFIKSRIDKLPNGNQWTTTHALIEGRSRYEWYMPKWAGVDMLTGRSLYEINKDCHKWDTQDNDESSPTFGQWFFDEDKWNSNLENAEEAGALVKIGDRYYTTNTSYASNEFVGTSLPTVYGSIGTSLSWKGLNVSLLFTYSLGGKTLDGNYRSLMSGGQNSAWHRDVLNSWEEAPAGMDENTVEGRINPNINPQLNLTNSSENNNSSSRWLTSNDYLCFKNLNINYDLPKKWVSPLKLSNINVGFAVDNLFTATARKGMNPTYNSSGGQGNYFVTSRVFSFQLTARF